MPREPWRDDPVYQSLWRSARQHLDEFERRLVLADWLEENGHSDEAWRERLHGLTENVPDFNPDTRTARAGLIPLTVGAWSRLLAAPPADDLLCVFDRDVRAYQYLRQYRGRCGWDLGQDEWSSRTELDHLLAIPRLEMLACNLVRLDSWSWIIDHMPGLIHFEARGPMIDPDELASLNRLPHLRHLDLRGYVTRNIKAIQPIPNLSHLTLEPYYFEVGHLPQSFPELESLHCDLIDFDNKVLWPRLRSLWMSGRSRYPALKTKDVQGIAQHPLLERLKIRCGKLTSTAIKALAALPHLRELEIRFDNEVPSLKALADAPALESLTIEGSLNERRFDEILNITSLRVLSIDQVPAGSTLAGLTQLQQLEEVVLSGENEDPSGLPALGSLPHLRKLDVQSLTMTTETAEAIQSVCPPWVECLVPGEDE